MAGGSPLLHLSLKLQSDGKSQEARTSRNLGSGSGCAANSLGNPE